MMFLQRLISVLILVPMVLLALFRLNPWVLAEALTLVTLIMGKEYWQLIPLNQVWKQMVYLLGLGLSIWACGVFFPYWQTVGLLVWLALCCAIVTFPKSQNYWGYPIVVIMISLITLPFFIQSLVHLYSLREGKELLVYLLFLVWAADTGAYLVGKVCGKHKMIPEVSPGKSWEGTLGGFVLAMLVAVGAYIYFKPYSIVIWFSLAAVTAISSVFGDLCISILKRRCHLKDTGELIPGHGGMLDRLDSLLAALPVFYFGLMFIPVGI